MAGVLRHTKSSGSTFAAPIKHKQIISLTSAEAGRINAERTLLGRRSYRKKVRTSFGKAELHVMGVGPKKYRARLQAETARQRYKVYDPNFKTKYGGF